MLVIPVRLGYYGHIRRYPKEHKRYSGPFKLQHPSHFSRHWMAECDARGRVIRSAEETYNLIKPMKVQAAAAPAKIETKTNNNVMDRALSPTAALGIDLNPQPIPDAAQIATGKDVEDVPYVEEAPEIETFEPVGPVSEGTSGDAEVI